MGRQENVPSLIIKNIRTKWSEVQSFIEKYHSDKAVASRVVKIFIGNDLSHFRQILKQRQKKKHLWRDY